jgi:hypothetical protein
MNEQELEQLKYPIGRFKKSRKFHSRIFRKLYSIIENFPENLRKKL